jgi:hypothetical protein
MLSGQPTQARIKTQSKPFPNLMRSALTLMSNTKNPLHALSEIAKLPKDQHGNILIGLDTNDFNIWRGKLEHLVPKKIFGPIMIPTKTKVIGALLSQLKGGTSAPFAGNRSTSVVAGLTGQENVFAAKNSEVHSIHKGQFKTFLTDPVANIKKVAPVIHAWLNEQSHHRQGKWIDDKALATLSAQVMLTFLLNSTSGAQPELSEAIIHLKTHFVNKVGFKKLGRLSLFNGYRSAKSKMSAEIVRLYHSDEPSYPAQLAKHFTVEQTISHVLSLMMVGFDNLQSSLMSLLIQLAQNPEYLDALQNDLLSVDGIPYLQFDPALPHQDELTLSHYFFKEALRLAPPVWLQARKNKNEERAISYLNDAGGSVSFVLPSATMVLIPNFQLAREMENGHVFDPARWRDNHSLFQPFSVGPNACPGRNISYAAAGVLIAELVKWETRLTLLQKPNYDPQVSLVWKNIKLELQAQIKPRTSISVSPRPAQYLLDEDYKISLMLGMVVAVAAYSKTENLLTAFSAGTLAAMLVLFFLSTNKKALPAGHFFQSPPRVSGQQSFVVANASQVHHESSRLDYADFKRPSLK